MINWNYLTCKCLIFPIFAKTPILLLSCNKKQKTMKKLIAWVEIPATDFQRAVDFYNTVLKLDLNAMDFGHEKMALFPNDEGAISFAPNFKPSSDGVLVSLDTGDDLDGTIKRVEENGGKIVHPKTKIEAEGRGYFALFIDSEGNKVGLYGN